MFDAVWGMLKGIWRTSGPTLVASVVSMIASSPLAFILVPVLKGLTCGYKEYLKRNNKEIPAWFSKLPF